MNSNYLAANKERFGTDERVIEKLAQLMEKESALLKAGLDFVPSIWNYKNPSVWTAELREKQVKVLAEFSGLEKQVNRILKTEIK